MRSRWLPVVAGLLLVSACSDTENPAPTAPTAPEAPPAELQIGPTGCPTSLQLRTQLTQLFVQPGQILIVNLKFTGIELAVLAKKTTLAQNLMFALVQYVLDRYNHGDLRGGKSPETQAKLVALIKGLYCFVGLPEPNLSSVALGPDGVAAVVQPSATQTTTLVTETKFAGVQIPPGAISTPTLVTITRLPNFPGPLNTVLDQYPAFYEYTSSPATAFNTDVIVGVCQVQDFAPPDFGRLKLGHNVGNGIELLRRVPAPFIDCTNLLSMHDPGNGWFQLVRRGWHSLEPLAAMIFLPEKAYAVALGTCCLGGGSKTFSPFGAVDTLTSVSAISPVQITGFAGAAVPAGILPSVKVVTPTLQPVPGLTVTFSIPAGSEGSVTGASQTTNADGVATLGGWALGTGSSPDRVIATVTSFPGSGVLNNGLVFSADVTTATPLPYLSGGYRYLLIGSGAAPEGFAAPNFPDADWPLGAAAFGSGPGSPDGCALDATVHTIWPAATDGVSDLLLRHSFGVPNGFTGSASVSVAIDNDIQVFVNGVDITASAGSETLVNGFQTHEGCAAQGSLVFTVPNSTLVPGGANLVAVRARDRGQTSYVDLEVRLGE